MKPIKNKNTHVCGCTIIRRRKRNGRLVRLTNAQCDRINDEYENYDKLCHVDRHGNCIDQGWSGHTRIGAIWGTICKKCGRTKVSFAHHENFPENPTMSRRTSNGLPIPRLRRPTAEIIRTQNECRDDGYFDYDDNGREGLYDEDYDQQW